MMIAAIILSTLSLLVSLATLVIFLAKNVFSSHVIQYVPAESMMPANSKPGKTMDDELEEFDFRSPMDAAFEEKAKPN
jgi:hypothetical protein